MANSSSYVVDFQAFKNLRNEFILKEVTIIDIVKRVDNNFLIRPPQPYNQIPHKLKKRVDFITNNIHGLEWDSGMIGFRNAVALIKGILKDASKIYIKGSERVNYLKKLLPDKENCIIDLDPIVPKIIPPLPISECAFNHKINHKCSYKQAHKYLIYVYFYENF